jgi:hypothetical protein
MASRRLSRQKSNTAINGRDASIIETGFLECQGISPITQRLMRFEPRQIFLVTEII